MPQLNTLLEFAGAKIAPHRLAEAAVLMIDAHREYVDGRLALAGIDAALEEGGRLLAAARKAGRPVVHVRHRGKAGGLFDPEGAYFSIAVPVAPRPGEPVVDKSAPNAFARTPLDDLKG